MENCEINCKWNKLQAKIDLFSNINCCKHFLFALFHSGICALSATKVLVFCFLCECWWLYLFVWSLFKPLISFNYFAFKTHTHQSVFSVRKPKKKKNKENGKNIAQHYINYTHIDKRIFFKLTVEAFLFIRSLLIRLTTYISYFVFDFPHCTKFISFCLLNKRFYCRSKRLCEKDCDYNSTKYERVK